MRYVFSGSKELQNRVLLLENESKELAMKLDESRQMSKSNQNKLNELKKLQTECAMISNNCDCLEKENLRKFYFCWIIYFCFTPFVWLPYKWEETRGLFYLLYLAMSDLLRDKRMCHTTCNSRRITSLKFRSYAVDFRLFLLSKWGSRTSISQ